MSGMQQDNGDPFEPVNEGSLSHNDDLLEGGGGGSWGPIGPDGGPMMASMQPASKPPPYAAEFCPCLRGPCEFLHEVWTHFDHGNAVDALAEQPKQRRISCMAQRGVYLEMSADAPVLECNLWRPRASSQDVESRRRNYYRQHPEHDQARKEKERAAANKFQGEF